MAEKTEGKAQMLELEALRQELDELKAALEAKAAPAPAPAPAAPAPTVERSAKELKALRFAQLAKELEEPVDVKLFKDGRRYDDDVFVGVNGESVLVKRGVPVQMKRKYALAFEQSAMQDVMAVAYADGEQRKLQGLEKAGII